MSNTAPTADQLVTYVGANPDKDTNFATSKLTEAVHLVDRYIGSSEVPEPVYQGAVLEVASKLWARRGAADDAAQTGMMDAPPMLPARDPLISVYPVLDRYTGGGFG